MKRSEAIRSVTPGEYAPGKTFLEEGYEYPLKGAIGQILATPKVLSRASSWRVEYRISEDSPPFHPEMAKRLASIPEDQIQFVEKARARLEDLATRPGVHADARLIAGHFLENWPHILGEPFLLRSQDEEGCQIKFFGWGEASSETGASTGSSFVTGIAPVLGAAGSEVVGSSSSSRGGATGKPLGEDAGHGDPKLGGAFSEMGGQSPGGDGADNGPLRTVAFQSRRNWFPWLVILLMLILLLIFILSRPGCGLVGDSNRNDTGANQLQGPGSSPGEILEPDDPVVDLDDQSPRSRGSDSQQPFGDRIQETDSMPDSDDNASLPGDTSVKPDSSASDVDRLGGGDQPSGADGTGSGPDGGENGHPPVGSFHGRPQADQESNGLLEEIQRGSTSSGGKGALPEPPLPEDDKTSLGQTDGIGTETSSRDSSMPVGDSGAILRSPDAEQHTEMNPAQREGEDDLSDEPVVGATPKVSPEAVNEAPDSYPLEGIKHRTGNGQEGDTKRSGSLEDKNHGDSREAELEQPRSGFPAASGGPASEESTSLEPSSEEQDGSYTGPDGSSARIDGLPPGAESEQSALDEGTDDLKSETSVGGKPAIHDEPVVPEPSAIPLPDVPNTITVHDEAGNSEQADISRPENNELYPPTGPGGPERSVEPDSIRSISSDESAEESPSKDSDHSVNDREMQRELDGVRSTEYSDDSGGEGEVPVGSADHEGNAGESRAPEGESPRTSVQDGSHENIDPEADLADLIQRAKSLGGLIPPLEFVWRIEHTSRELQGVENGQEVVGLQPRDPRPTKTLPVVVDYRLMIRGSGGDEFDAGIVRVRYESE